MEKITVQHFINKELNCINEAGKQKYPVYVQVITLRKSLRFRSHNSYFKYLSDDDLKNTFVQNILEDEKNIIGYIVRDLIKIHQKKLVTSKNLSLFSQGLNETINNNFPKFLLHEQKESGKFIPNILIASYKDISDVLYFFNNDIPFIEISENIRYCLEALKIIYCQSELFYVYDLFFGEKKEVIKDMFDYSGIFDDNEKAQMINILQKITML